jgi:hypothetical protein
LANNQSIYKGDLTWSDLPAEHERLAKNNDHEALNFVSKAKIALFGRRG